MQYEQATSIKTYLDVIPPDRKAQLQKVRAIINKIAPRAKEEFAYGMLYFPLGDPLFALASQKHFMALYVSSTELVKQYQPQLGKVSVGKSCIRFTKLDNLKMDALQALVFDVYEQRCQKMAATR